MFWEESDTIKFLFVHVESEDKTQKAMVFFSLLNILDFKSFNLESGFLSLVSSTAAQC